MWHWLVVNLTGAAYVTLTGGQSHGCSISDIDWRSMSRMQHKWHWLVVNVTDAAYVTLTGGQSHGCSIRDIDWWSISRMLHIWHWLVGQCHLCCTSDIDWWHWPPLYYHGIYKRIRAPDNQSPLGGKATPPAHLHSNTSFVTNVVQQHIIMTHVRHSFQLSAD